MLSQIREDIKVAMVKDPAARTMFEVLLCYPGVHALIFYRVSNWLWRHGFHLPGRMLSYFARWFTGIEIHPAAQIGRRLFIDHGMGVVIGETSIVGDNVFMYHGVTLGGLSMKKGRRHPTVGDNVMIGANAQVLGPITIGSHTKIGSGSVVLENVEEYSTVIGVPGRVVFSGLSPEQEDEEGLQAFPDPVARAIECMLDRIPQMEREIRTLKESLNERDSSVTPQAVPLKQTKMKKVSGE
ncbi:MAG: serine O-acetyltransferase [Nitrospinales bacterium]